MARESTMREYWGIAAVLPLALLMLAFASCNGGDTLDMYEDVGGTQQSGGNTVEQFEVDGPLVYEGQQKPDPEGIGDLDKVGPPHEIPFDFGQNIFSIPLDTTGTGRVVASNFSPGQKVAFVVVNMNPLWLDAHASSTIVIFDPDAEPDDPPQFNNVFPTMPDVRYSVTADLIVKGASSMAPIETLTEATQFDLGEGYSGMDYTGEIQHPFAIYEREARAQGLVPFAAPSVKATSQFIQKGEIRSFPAVARTFPPPPIPPGPEDPERDVDDLDYPFEYRNSQDGRLVAIGVHCMIFLSTEINNGHPDVIQFTEARLHRLANEFDTKIFQIMTTAFGPVTTYDDANRLVEIDRTILLNGDDFDDQDELLINLPGRVDTLIALEEKIAIFLFNSGAGGAGGFFVPGLTQEAADLLREEGREDLIEELAEVGSTLYIDANNFPANDNSWEAGYSIIAHEFQHKLYSDNGLPRRPVDPEGSNYVWFNEGMSMMAIHVCGYTANSGRIVPWAIDGQLTDFMANIYQAPIPMDGNRFVSNQWQYGGGFLFFLYLFEHYDPGAGTRIYSAARQGETSFVKLLEAGAQITVPGPDGIIDTADDIVGHDTFEQFYAKFAIANFIDGVYADNALDLFDPRFHYNTIDLRGTVNLVTGTIVLPGVNRASFPGGGTYPATSIHRSVRPWSTDYVIFSNGDKRDLEVTFYTDPHFKIFMLPVTYNPLLNAVEITPGVAIN